MRCCVEKMTLHHFVLPNPVLHCNCCIVQVFLISCRSLCCIEPRTFLSISLYKLYLTNLYDSRDALYIQYMSRSHASGIMNGVALCSVQGHADSSLFHSDVLAVARQQLSGVAELNGCPNGLFSFSIFTLVFFSILSVSHSHTHCVECML